MSCGGYLRVIRFGIRGEDDLLGNRWVHLTTAMRTNRVDSASFIPRCCALRRTHTSSDLLRLLCIRLDLPLTLSLPSRLAPSARLTVGVSFCALWLAGAFSRGCTFLGREGRRAYCATGGPTGEHSNHHMTTVMSANRVDSGRFSSRCCTFRRTRTSADPIWLPSIRLAFYP